MRLLLVARALDRMAGGVERMIIAIAGEMAARGHEACLLTWDRADALPFYPISRAVSWCKLDVGNPQQKADWSVRLQRAFAVRRIVGSLRPDVVVAFQAGTFKATRLYCSGMNIPMIAAERNAPTLYDHVRNGEVLRRKAFAAFRRAHLLVVQCESQRLMYPPFLHDKLTVIPNPVYSVDVTAMPGKASANGRFRLLALGRLSFQKNFEALIVAFAQLAPMFPEWDLDIVGEGESRPELEALIRERQLSARVALPGATTEPSGCYVSSHLFCLPSRWEGFPNALAEAMAHGLPAVGFADTAGVNDLIEHGKTGLLAAGNGDVTALAAALDTLMRDGERRAAMGAAGRSATAQYTPDAIMTRWEATFRQAIGGAG